MAVLGVSLSTTGLSAAKGIQLIAAREELDGTLPRGKGAAESTTETKTDTKTRAAVSANASGKTAAPNELTPEQKRVVSELQRIDQVVREHEAAHLRAGAGVVTSGASFSYTYGPDGKQYAIGGEVGIDTSPEQKPEANIDKGQRIQIAALAPAEPSSQDYRIAAIGGRIEQLGYSGLAEQRALQLAEKAAAQRLERAQRNRGDTVPAATATGRPNATREALAQAYPASTVSRSSRIDLLA